MHAPMCSRAGRWFHRCGGAVLLVSLVACAEDTPVSPSASPVPSSPATPSPKPAPPGAPGAVKLTLSRTDVVFNTMAGAALSDSAAIAVTAASGEAVTDLRASVGYAQGKPQDWLTVELDQATLPAKLSLRAKSPSLTPGEYTATVRLAAPGAAPESLSVTAHVASGPGIGLNATKICFTTTIGADDPRPDDVRITSIDGTVIDGLTATIVYDPGEDTGWLSASLDRTVTPARLWLSADTRIAISSTGTRTATVQVSSPQAGNSPVAIRVTVTVNEVDPAKVSRLFVSIDWEGPGSSGTGQVDGRFGISCPVNSCVGVLPSGIGETELIPDANYGARFLRWEGACTGFGECIVQFDTPGTTKHVSAVFRTRPSSVRLQLRGDGASGSVTVSPTLAGFGGNPFVCNLVQGVAQPGCGGELEAGSGTLTLTATPAPGSRFAGWEVTAVDFYNYPSHLTTCAEPLSTTCVLTFGHGDSNLDGYVNFAPQ